MVGHRVGPVGKGQEWTVTSKGGKELGNLGEEYEELKYVRISG